MGDIANKSFVEEINKWGFTKNEISQLGLISFNKFSELYGFDLLHTTTSGMKSIYYDIIRNPHKFIDFANWVIPRFEKFIMLDIPLRIYIGGQKQFLQRGDVELEKALSNVLSFMKTYVETGYITPKRITIIIYYLNLII